jgi:flagellar biosynthesis protein FlhG
MPGKPDGPKSGRRLGRGLSQVSHVFLSGAARPEPLAGEIEDPGLWLPDAGLISVTSGETVRGKTLVASNLTFGLYQCGRKVAVVNADPSRPGILDVISDADDARDRAVWQSDPGLGRIAAVDLEGSAASELAGEPPSRPLGLIEPAARQAQFVIVDASPKTRWSQVLWKFSRVVIVVTEANTEKMQASYATIKKVNAVSHGRRIGLVVNLVQGHEEAESCFRKISGVCRRFLKINLRNYGYIVHSDEVYGAYQRAVPLMRAFPESRAATCISSIIGLIVMDESAIAKRRREVKEEECALRGGK